MFCFVKFNYFCLPFSILITFTNFNRSVIYNVIIINHNVIITFASPATYVKPVI